jgi:hypothetical protein
LLVEPDITFIKDKTSIMLHSKLRVTSTGKLKRTAHAATFESPFAEYYVDASHINDTTDTTSKLGYTTPCE